MILRRTFSGALAVAAFAAPPHTVKARRKPSDAWTEYPTRTLADLPAVKQVNVGRYGGRLDRKGDATGFFHTKKLNGRHWLIDPDGCLAINLAVVSVSPGRSKRNRSALTEKFGNEMKWAEETTKLIRSRGFSGVGNWSAIDALRAVPEPLVYTAGFNLSGNFGRRLGIVHQQSGHLGYVNDVIPVFHPDFPAFCHEETAPAAARAKDLFLLGTFSDNELPAPQDLLDKSLSLDESNEKLAPGRRAAVSWLRARKGESANLSDVTAEDREAFRGHVFDRYLSVTSAALRKRDPNHLLLGPRFHGGSLRSAAIWRAAGRHLDVVATNVYWQWSPDKAMLDLWRKEAGRPFIVTEFYAKGSDAGFANTSGAGWIVPTQKDRAAFYQNFTLGCLESRLCVGWHWFKYMDNDPEDLTTDPSNRDSNKGIVTADFRPYDSLLADMEAWNRSVYGVVDALDR